MSALEQEIPKGYLKTEHGIFPSDWSVLTLDDVCSFVGGAQPEKSVFSYKEQSGYIRLIQIRDYKSDKDIVYIPEKLARKKCSTIDIMIGRYGPPIFQILRGIEGAYNVALIKATPKENIEREFLYYFLKNDSLFELMDMLSQRSSGQTGVELPALKSYPIGLPPKKEQTAIANALSDVDALISELEKLIAKKQAIKTATMQQLLTGRTRLPQFALREDGTPKGTKPSELGEIPEDWELQSLQEMASANGLVRGPFGGAIKKEHFTKTGYKVYEQRNAIYATIDIGNYFIDQKKFDELKRFSVSSGDFIVSCSGTIGRIYQIPEKNPEGVINQALLKITLNDNINSKYFHHYFKWDEFQERIIDGTQGGAMKNLVGMAEFKQSLMPVPSLKEEQTAIATILSDMDAEIQALEQRLGKTRQIKQGMMQELLTGKTRLIKPSKEVIHE
ncbi:restriction endonuclease subunit S [Vibrio cholerae]